MSWINRLLGSLRKNKLEEQLDEELQFHIEMRMQEFVAAGMAPEEARRQAERLFGNHTLLKERTRDMNTIGWIETLWQDLRYACRMLRKNPAFAAAAVITLALGIGANTAIFSVVDAALIEPLPYADPGRLFSIREYIPQLRNQIPDSPVRAHDFLQWRRSNTTFSGLSALGPAAFNLTGDGEPERLGGARVSANFFSLVGVQPTRGRAFLPDEDQAGRDHVAIISDELWARRFASDPAVLGRTLSLDGKPYMVVGILPRAFVFPTGKQLHSRLPFAARIDVWAPLVFDQGETQEGGWNYGVLARVKPGTTAEQARQQMDVIATRIIREELVRVKSGLKVDLRTEFVPIREVFTGNVRKPLLVILGAVAVLLLIACVNLANLFLARVISRSKEFATRHALGAARGRLIRQLLTESVMIACLGGAGGIVLAQWATRLLLWFAPPDIPRFQAADLNGQVLLFTLAIALFTGIAFGTLPAVQTSRKDLYEDLKEGSRGSKGGPRADRIRRILIAAEVALSTVLLTAAGLLLHSFIQVMNVDKGFSVEKIISDDLSLPDQQYSKELQRVAFYRELVERVRALPGVISAGAISLLPLSIESDNTQIYLETDTKISPDRPAAVYRNVTPGYFATMQIPLRAGRFLTGQENAPVALISEGLARRLWPGEPLSGVIGRRIREGNVQGDLISVVGVTGEIYAAELDRQPMPQIYRPHTQAPFPDMSLVVRTAQDPRTLASAIRSEIWKLDKNLPVPTMKTMREIVAASVAQRRFQMLLICLFAVLALALALVGIYGVVSYSVTRHTREIGLRIALGAQRSEVLGNVVMRGLRPVLAGLVCGVAGAMAGATALRSLLFGIRPVDPVALCGVVCVLLVASTLACYLPARRASRVDPMAALRYE